MESPEQPEKTTAQQLVPPELETLGPRELLVTEFFHSIQGESTHAGRPCFFIRLTGCLLRCSYCDSEYAFFEGHRETVDSCIQKAMDTGCQLVEVTGGEPLTQPATPDLLTGLCDQGFEVLLETNGSISLGKVDIRVKKIVDIKCPSSGMASRNHHSIAAELGAGDELKFVMSTRQDFDWATEWIRREDDGLPAGIPIHFSPVHGRLSPDELSRWILDHRLPVRLNLQIHKYVWPGVERGV